MTPRGDGTSPVDGATGAGRPRKLRLCNSSSACHRMLLTNGEPEISPARHAGWSHNWQPGGPMKLAENRSERSHTHGRRQRLYPVPDRPPVTRRSIDTRESALLEATRTGGSRCKYQAGGLALLLDGTPNGSRSARAQRRDWCVDLVTGPTGFDPRRPLTVERYQTNLTA